MTFGEKLKIIRQTKNITVEQLADKLSVFPNTIHNWEEGNSEPDFEMIKKISTVLGVNSSVFFDEGINELPNTFKKTSSQYNLRHLKQKYLMTVKIFLILGIILNPIIQLGGSILLNAYILGEIFIPLVVIIDVAATIVLGIYSVRSLDKASSKKDLVGWGIVSLIMVSLVGGILMLCAKDDKDFEGSSSINQKHHAGVTYNPEFLTNRADALFKNRQYIEAARFYVEANKALGGNDAKCLAQIIRCNTNNLNTIVEDIAFICTIVSKKYAITDEEVLEYISKIQDNIDSMYKESYHKAISYLNDKDYTNALIELKNVNVNYYNTKELLAECVIGTKNEEEYTKALECISNKKYFKAVSILKKLKGYKDSNTLVSEYSKRNRKVVIITSISSLSLIIVAVLSIVLISTFSQYNGKYNEALKLRESNNVEELDDLMLKLTEKDIKFFIKKQKSEGNVYFEGPNSMYEYYLGSTLDPEVIIISNGCRVICKGACSSLTHLNEITIPSSVEKIGEKAFKGCPIKKASIPSSLFWIFPHDVLEDLTISNGTKINYAAFNDAPKLKTIVIADTITEVGDKAFDGCPIEYAVIPACVAPKIPKDNLKSCEIINGAKVEDYSFEYCSSLENIRVCDGIKEIGRCAFSNCTSLKSIHIPTSVETIGHSAFIMCSSITEIKLPSNVKTIGQTAFFGIKNLNYVDIGKTTTIGYQSFGMCGTIESFIMPKELTKIEQYAFKGTSVKIIYYYGSSLDWDEINIADGNESLNTSTFYYYSEEEPSYPGIYWHMVDGVPTIWK